MSETAGDRGLEYMTFRAYRDACFTDERDASKPDGYKVMINPESFERTLAVKTEQDKSARSGNSSGIDAGFEPEKYSFDLYFDGTGVAGPALGDGGLSKKFNQFLDVVYATRISDDCKKEPNFVEMTYCRETFCCKLTSMTVRYLLFRPNGQPLRIKATCQFSSVEKSKPEEKKDNKPKTVTKVPPVKKDSPNCSCVCPQASYEQTVSSAKENDSASLLTSGYSRAQMSTNLNYSPIEGY